MIKINLLGNDTAIDFTSHIVVGAYVSSMVVTLGLCLFVASWLGGEIEDLEREKVDKQASLKRIQAVTQEVKEIEKKQKSLEDRLVRIATLKRNKQGPVRVLDSLNTAIPERAWLVEAREKSGIMVLNGLALDGETVSSFMRELEKSDYFPKIELDVAKQAIKQGVKIQEFVIRASVSYAGKMLAVEPADQKVNGKREDKKK
jgi:type IV pilus assembly protein PilN